MRRHLVTLAVALCAAAALPGAMGTSSAAPSAAHTVRQQSAGPVLVDCFWHAHVRPTDFMIACGDGNSRLTSLRWSSWGTNTAVATGVNVVNDCKPYCAAGRFHAHPVIVRLDRPHPWKKNPRLEHYTRMSLSYTGSSRPAGFPRVVTYPLWN